MLGWCIVTLASARLKASVRFPPLRGMYQTGGTCKGCDSYGHLKFSAKESIGGPPLQLGVGKSPELGKMSIIS